MLHGWEGQFGLSVDVVVGVRGGDARGCTPAYRPTADRADPRDPRRLSTQQKATHMARRGNSSQSRYAGYLTTGPPADGCHAAACGSLSESNSACRFAAA